MRIKDYVVIREDTVPALIFKVQACIQRLDLQPVGGVSPDGTGYMQAMVEYERVF